MERQRHILGSNQREGYISGSVLGFLSFILANTKNIFVGFKFADLLVTLVL